LEIIMSRITASPSTQSLEVVWDTQLVTPVQAVINDQRYGLSPTDDQFEPAEWFHERVTSEADSVLLSLGRVWAHASAEECERALAQLVHWREYSLPESLAPEFVALLARLYVERAVVANEEFARSVQQLDALRTGS
jgi:hypothetical protein